MADDKSRIVGFEVKAHRWVNYYISVLVETNIMSGPEEYYVFLLLVYILAFFGGSTTECKLWQPYAKTARVLVSLLTELFIILFQCQTHL